MLSSAWEGLPTVLIEAMAVGTPVVATDCKSGPTEILQNGKYGQLVQVGDIEGLAEAIINNLKQTQSTKILQDRALDFSAENSLIQYLSLLS